MHEQVEAIVAAPQRIRVHVRAFSKGGTHSSWHANAADPLIESQSPPPPPLPTFGKATRQNGTGHPFGALIFVQVL